MIYNLTLEIFCNSHSPCSDIQRSTPVTSFIFLKMLQPYYKVISHFLNLACSLGWTQNHWRQISVQFSSVAQLYLTLCDPMNRIGISIARSWEEATLPCPLSKRWKFPGFLAAVFKVNGHMLTSKKLAVTRSKKKHKRKMLTFRFSQVGKKFFPKK